MSLLYIGQQFTIYGGFSLLVAGIVGNGMNIWIFSSVRTYRGTPCSFYFLVASVDNILYLLINLTTRILSGGYGIDFTTTSTVWCKTRSFLLSALGAISYNCSCLATIDQFLVTSRSVSLRRWSNIKWAHRIIFVVIIIWCLSGVPYFVYYDISPISKTCVNTNTFYIAYITTELLIVVYAGPLILLPVFGYLTYRNIRLIRVLAEGQAARQLAKMTLIQIVFVIISGVPYVILNIYNMITTEVSKDVDRQQKEYFASTIVLVTTYFHYVVCIFIFYDII
jgi:hypothetical protein